MKKVISLLLAVMMVFSVVAVGAVSASAAEGDIAFEAGSRIFFDNSDAKWTNVYMYAWGYGYTNDFIPMEPYKGNKELLSVVVPQEVPDGKSYFLFTNSTTWSGVQTADQTATAGLNTYAPSADGKAVVKSYTKYEVEPEVAITPYSKDFTDTIDVTVYAFNLEKGQIATYQLNDEEAVKFDDAEELEIEETTAVTVKITDISGNVVVSTSCTFTKKSDAFITVELADGVVYDGPMYVYTYGGDRIYPDFNLMEKDGSKYTYKLNGSAHVIFTTANNWGDAVKFLILNDDGSLAADQEPLVDFGETPTFTVKLP